MQAKMKEGQHRQRHTLSKGLEDALRGIIRSTVTVKAQGVTGRDGVRGFLTFAKDLNYAQLCLLYGLM